MGIEKQLKKGVLDILILTLLSKNQKLYGYELIRMLKNTSVNYYSLKEGSLYPVLYRLEDKGLIKNEIYYTEGKRGVPRKYYSITDFGIEMQKEYLNEWRVFKESTEAVLYN